MNKIRTKPNLKLVIFALVGVLLSAGVIVLITFVEKNFALMVTLNVFCSLFLLAGLIILWAQLLNFSVLNGDTLTIHRGIFYKKVLIKDITRIVNKDGMFDIYKGDKRMTSLSSDDENTKRIIVLLEKSGISVVW